GCIGSNPAGDVEPGDAGCLESLSHALAIRDVDAVIVVIGADDAGADRVLGAAELTDPLDNAQGKAHSTLEVPSVLVRSDVLRGRDKAEEQVGRTDVKLDAIETGILCPASGLAVGFDLLLDIVDRHFTWRIGSANHRQRRRRNRL